MIGLVDIRAFYGRIRIIWPDPDPLQETLIWIRVVKENLDKLELAYK